MTDGPVRVMPREPLVAERRVDSSAQRNVWWKVSVEGVPSGAVLGSQYTDAEFAAHFVPADAYERLIAACDVLFAPLGNSEHNYQNARAAYRAYVGGDV